MNLNIVEECYKKSIELLTCNSTDYGISASANSERAVKKNYDAIFARDAGICVLGLALSGNKKLVKAAEKSLINLALYQAGNGQIPNFVKPEAGKSDFWYIGCIDATLWWLVAVKFFDKYAKPERILEKRLAKNIAGAINWLEAQEHPKLFLLAQNEASDWADKMPRTGYVLYTNSLWYPVKKLYGLNNAKETKQAFNFIFNPWQKIPDKFYKKFYRSKRLIKMIKAKKSKQNYCLSYVNYSFWGDDADVFGNALAILAGLPENRKSSLILKSLTELRKKKSLPMPALFNPIFLNTKFWRDYMILQKDNYPYQYHNGGIWPFVSVFWAMALARAGKKKEAEEELKRVALANSRNNWQFNEWFSPKTGQPMGMAGQSWNAGAFIAAYHYLKGRIKIFS